MCEKAEDEIIRFVDALLPQPLHRTGTCDGASLFPEAAHVGDKPTGWVVQENTLFR